MLSGVNISLGGPSIIVRGLPGLVLPFAETDFLLDVLSAAMDSGLAVSIILIFFCLEYPDNGSIGLHTIQTWWGNTVYAKTADGQYTALWTLPEGSTFG